MSPVPSVSIVGAGVSGLTLAACLAKKKAIYPKLYEKRSADSKGGSGLILSINANRVFKELGLLETIQKKGAVLTEAVTLTHSGEIITKITSDYAWKEFGLPMIGIHRQDLNACLAESMPNLSITYNKTVASVEVRGDGVSLRFSDYDELNTDFVVGCDGLNSTIRQYIYGSESDPLISRGYTCWRGVCVMPRNTSLSSFREFLGGGFRFGIVPIGQSQVYWYAAANISQAPQSKFKTQHKADMLDLFKDWSPEILAILEATPDGDIYRHNIYTRRMTLPWFKGPVAITGDAAHSMQPFLGQGASMAIESAFELAKCLTVDSHTEIALRNYQTQRYPRVKKIVQMSDFVGRLGGIENPFLERLRNLGMRHTPQFIVKKQLSSLFSHTL